MTIPNRKTIKRAVRHVNRLSGFGLPTSRLIVREILINHICLGDVLRATRLYPTGFVDCSEADPTTNGLTVDLTFKFNSGPHKVFSEDPFPTHSPKTIKSVVHQWIQNVNDPN